MVDKKSISISMKNLHPINEIANILNLPLGEVLKLKEELCIDPVYETLRYKYYRVEQFQKIEKYYPMKTTETFYIYESKMNTQ